MKAIIEKVIEDQTGFVFETSEMPMDIICDKLSTDFNLRAYSKGCYIYIDDKRVASIEIGKDVEGYYEIRGYKIR